MIIIITIHSVPLNIDRSSSNTNNDKPVSFITNQTSKRGRGRPQSINYNKPIIQDIIICDANEYSTINNHHNISSHDLIDVSKPTTSKNSMTYSYHCALNGISSFKKVKYSTDSKLPFNTIYIK